MGEFWFAVLGPYGVWGAWLAFFAQGTGVPVPLVVTFAWLVALEAAGRLALFSALVVAFTASWLGNMVAFLGAANLVYLFRGVGRLCRRSSGQLLEAVNHNLIWAMLLTRWTGAYPQVLWLAGVSRQRWWRVALAALLCNGPWVLFWFSAITWGWTWAGSGAVLVGTGVVLAFLAWLGLRTYRSR